MQNKPNVCLNVNEKVHVVILWVNNVCSNNPMLHDEVKDLYIAAVKASPQDVDADVQVNFLV